MNAVLLIVLLGIGLLLSGFRKTSAAFLYGGMAFVFAIVIAHRQLTVPDTEIYLEFYMSLKAVFRITAYGFEPGFQFFSRVAKWFFRENYTLYFGLIAGVNMALVYKSIVNLDRRDEEYGFRSEGWRNRVLPLILYLAYFGLYYNAIVLRAGIAISLLIWATTIACKPVKTRTDYWKTGLLNLLAFSFHYTAILGIPVLAIMLFSDKKRLRTYLLIWLVIGGVYFSGIGTWMTHYLFTWVVGLLFHADTLFLRFLAYEDNALVASAGVSFKFIFYWLLGFIFLNVSEMPRYYYKYLNLYLAGILIFAFFKSLLLVERISDYFLIYSFILLFLYLRHRVFTLFSFFLYLSSVFIQLIFALRILNRSPF